MDSLDRSLSLFPKLVAAGVLLLVAWVLATIVRTLVTKDSECDHN